ncbi:hypothetical protein SLE2022_159900 [Rubroshorea leprosula]
MASPSELTLDIKPCNYSMLLKSFGDHQETDQSQKLEEFLACLEDERLKIDAFKRELPLCMQLLTNAVEVSRQQLQAHRARPVLEEFIPLKNFSSEISEKSSQPTSDKANWMTSAQLWTQAGNETKFPQPTITPSKDIEIGLNVSPKLSLDTKQRNGGAFLPFCKERNQCPKPSLQALPELALASTPKQMEDKKCSEIKQDGQRSENSSKVGTGQGVVEAKPTGNINQTDGQATNTNTTTTTTTQPHRKARRCWSPDLHRRFVSALQMLGGSQVATPKQIRELMKVDGLTNDEVKSHLQKYRLHTRRPSPSPQVTGAPVPQLVVLSGIWPVPPEYATAATAAHTGVPAALYGTHHPAATHAATHFCASPMPQDFYTAAAAAAATTPSLAPSPHLQHHTFHHQLNLYKAAAQAHSSPESDIGGTGDRSESIEDGKSDQSSSWKGESWENGGCGERKGLAALREDGEDSNGSEITLKF